MQEILSGIRVFDMTRVLAGPYCTALLADLGAEVIKLEPPHGDEYRHVGPFKNGESALFQLTNRGKQSIAVDLRHAAGRQVAADIALTCDIVVENFRPGVAQKLGLGAADLRAKAPNLIYASISGFGQSGPWTGRPAYDLIVQALSGFMAVNGEEGGPPLKVGESIGDITAGLFASWAILGALFRKSRCGEGCTIDVAMHDVLFSLLPTAHAQLFYANREPLRTGNRHPLSTPFGCYRAKDGLFAVAVLNEKHFASFAGVIGQPEIVNDPRFSSDSLRTQYEQELKELIEHWSNSKTMDEAILMLADLGIPAAAINSVSHVASSEQAVNRHLVAELRHHKLETIKVVGQPVVFDGGKPLATKAAPDLGRDAVAILSNIPGFDNARIVDLVKDGVLLGAFRADRN